MIKTKTTHRNNTDKHLKNILMICYLNTRINTKTSVILPAGQGLLLIHSRRAETEKENSSDP